jgi:ATP-dependent exoDNAse (exonuclease V) alpha subunit
MTEYFGDDLMDADIIPKIDALSLPPQFSKVDLSDKHYVKALDTCLNTNQNILVQGHAGTGKSLLIKIISQTKKNCVVLSTTGLTALNLCVDNIIAYTPHSFLLLPPHEIIPQEAMQTVSRKMLRALSSCNTLIIDEVSMMSNQLFDAIITKIQMVKSRLPQIILFGDMMQLPPVVSQDNKLIANFYQKNYNGKLMIFNSHCWPKLNFKLMKLRTSYRQKDFEFKENLFKIGYNDYTQETLDYFNKRVMTLPAYEADHKIFIQLCPTNTMVNKTNRAYIQNFQGKSMSYKAIVSGTYKGSVDDSITLKEGIQVMCTINNYQPGSSYRNGTMGIVKELYPDYAIIEKSDGFETKVTMSVRGQYDIAVDSKGKIFYKEIGSCTQIDCIPTKAITIHKSQGRSLDAAYISMNSWFPQGLMYVALSRLTTIDGLGLSQPLEKRMLSYNEEAFDFLEL